VTIRLLVLRALTRIGIPVPPRQLGGPCPRRSHPGAGRPRQKSAGYDLGVELPPRVLKALQARARKQKCSLAYLVRLALCKAGIPVEPEELIADRRRGSDRTPRSHYAQVVRAEPIGR
jgi:hypothetical protein